LPKSARIVWWRCLSKHGHTWQAKVAHITNMSSNKPRVYCPICG
jgi:hypothetical protein